MIAVTMVALNPSQRLREPEAKDEGGEEKNFLDVMTLKGCVVDEGGNETALFMADKPAIVDGASGCA